MDKNAKRGHIIFRNNAGIIANSHGSIVAANATLVSVEVRCITIPVDVYFGTVSYLDIYRVGRDAVVETVRSGQSRIVRDNNSTHDFLVMIIMFFICIRINIDAAASIFTIRTRIHKPADGEARIILNAQVTAVVDAQAAAARGFRLYIGDVHGVALVQNQCAGAKEYRRDSGVFLIGIGFAGVHSRIDSQLAAALNGHFAVGRIDALALQRQAVRGGIQRDILPLGRCANFRPIKPQALVIQRQIALQRNGSFAACGACSVNRRLQRRILSIANLSHHRVSNTGICLSLTAIAFLIGQTAITAAGRRIFLRIPFRIPFRISFRIPFGLHVRLAADSWPLRKVWSLRKGRGCKSRKRKAGCSRKYEQPFSHKYHS